MSATHVPMHLLNDLSCTDGRDFHVSAGGRRWLRTPTITSRDTALRPLRIYAGTSDYMVHRAGIRPTIQTCTAIQTGTAISRIRGIAWSPNMDCGRHRWANCLDALLG